MKGEKVLKPTGDLRVETGAHATRIRFEGNRAAGVEYVRGGATCTARARHEVIVCAGAVNSPQLLQLSGIGPAAHLGALGLPEGDDLRRLEDQGWWKLQTRRLMRDMGVINPDSIDDAKLRTYVAAGVSRVSFGVQSMVPHVLAALGRTHDPGNVYAAVRAARLRPVTAMHHIG